ncbi:MAG: ribonuclease Y [Candidatus Harrisonbacteria bacterium]|nr:ribonuclease Y [Candidatus Harrisonbacteria bacterium]
MLTNPFVWVFLLLGIAAGYFIRQYVAQRQASSAEQRIKNWLEEAKTQAKEVVLDAKERAAKLLEEVKTEEKSRKTQLDKLQEHILKKEETLEKQLADFTSQKLNLEEEMKRLVGEKAAIDDLRQKIMKELEKVASLSFEDAKKQLLEKVKEESKNDLLVAMSKLETERREEIEKRSLGIITTAIQRYARSHVADVTTSVFHLPNEELKGKIIGREGRNIRTLERLTGVEIVVDETPDTIMLSSYDPLRREIARMALEKLLKDGRIQPAKIEEKVEEARQELNKRMTEIGENATLEVGVVGLPKEIVQLLGRLYFRTSFGQNVLVHSIEMAHVAAMLAAELGANIEVAKKGALLHDIGKAIDHEVQGTHVELGRKLLQKYNIDEEVVKAMQSHHDEYPYSNSEAYIVTAADVLSAARPGARRGTVENYIKRLEDLEKIATGFAGVKNAYALSAGREIRVFVIPEKVDDFGALEMAKNIANKIQTDMKYPGEIKVNVIREMRAVEVAR